MRKNISIAAAALLSASALANAQSTQNSGTSSQAKPSAYIHSSSDPYSGTASPSDAPILTNQDNNAASVTQPAAQEVVPTPAAAPRSAYVSPSNPSPAAQDPDYGIVTTPVPDNSPAPSPALVGPTLKTHIYNPDADIVTSVPSDPNQLPEGTPFHARLVEELSADTITPGTPFTAQLMRDVVHMGRVVIPVGSYIHGRVTYVSSGRRIGGQSTMRLTPEEVILPDGTHYQFRGIVTQTAGSNTRTDSEGYVVNKDHLGRSAAELGMTAGSGAVIGAVVGGPVGAGVGTAIGAGVMTVHWLREKNAAVLPAGSFVTFGIRSPIMLSASATPASTATYSPAPASETPVVPAPAYVEPKVVN